MSSTFDDILTGESVQQLCDLYVGFREDFAWNPVINAQQEKCLAIQMIPLIWNNPSVIFCYSKRVSEFSAKLCSLTNRAVIVFGNSDKNMTEALCLPFLNSEKIIGIFCQNLLFVHPKATLLPIGVANSQWAHGNKTLFRGVDLTKTSDVFSSFSLHTNTGVRGLCIDTIRKKGVLNTPFTSQAEYISALAKHKFVICPEGNGVDTHRFWEAQLVKTVPIVVRSVFIENVMVLHVPCVVLERWTDFDPANLPPYESFTFDSTAFSLGRFKTQIVSLPQFLQ